MRNRHTHTSRVSKFLLVILFLLTGCSSFFEKPVHKIGVDPDFFSLEVDGMAPNIYAFCNELFTNISHEENVHIALIQTSWDILNLKLHRKEYEAILSASPRFSEAQDTYDHSSLILATGPVLVTPKTPDIKGLGDLSGKIVAFVDGSKNDLLLEGHPSITIKSYPSAHAVLQALLERKADGALLPNLLAQNYIHNLYNDTLQIVGNPLTPAGLRVVTLKGTNSNLLNFIDNALSSFRENGTLKRLQEKWQLAYPES